MINLTFQDAPLDDVFARIAQQAGLMPQLDPSLTGSFTGSLVNVPLDQALQTVRQGQSIDCSVQGGYLIVKPALGRSTAAGDPPSVTAAPAATVEPVAAIPQPALPAGPIARDYYPIRNKPALEVLQSARSVLPNIRYTVDERLNIIIAEGSPADIERLTTLLSNVSAK
jgi:type II secretory pathway component HofQ